MAEDFSKNLIKKYKHWAIYIHPNQGYLGRCVIWCNRKDALDLTNATLKEQNELFSILRNLKEATKEVFQPNWFNYSFLGNETKHLHCHFIPRYAKPKMFMNIMFEDKLYGHNYKTDHNFATPKEVLNTIRNKLSEMLK